MPIEYIHNYVEMSPASIGDGLIVAGISGEHISRFIETLTDEEKALLFLELRRYKINLGIKIP